MIGIVFHVYNFARDTELYMNWFRYISDKNNQTVRKILYNYQPDAIAENENFYELSNSFKCYPNPFSNFFYIKTKNSISTKLQISLFNLEGKQVYKNFIRINQKSKIIIDKNLATGVYFVKISNNQYHHSEKLFHIK